MAFRPSDTLLEKVVLVLWLVGVWSLRRVGWTDGRGCCTRSADDDGRAPVLARHPARRSCLLWACT